MWEVPLSLWTLKGSLAQVESSTLWTPRAQFSCPGFSGCHGISQTSTQMWHRDYRIFWSGIRVQVATWSRYQTTLETYMPAAPVFSQTNPSLRACSWLKQDQLNRACDGLNPAAGHCLEHLDGSWRPTSSPQLSSNGSGWPLSYCPQSASNVHHL